MASMSSIISLFVVLLATCCYSAPIEKEFESAVVDFQATTEISRLERELSPFTSSYEETTGSSEFRRRGVPVDDEDRTMESDEQTTELPMSSTAKMHKRAFESETQSWNDVVTDGSKTVKEHEHLMEKHEADEDTPVKREDDDDALSKREEEETTSTSEMKQWPRKRELELTTSTPEEEQAPSKRKVEQTTSTPEETPSLEVLMPAQTYDKRGNEQVMIGSDLATTVESISAFNSRAIGRWESESNVADSTEPTSSFESLAQSTGLIGEHEQRHGQKYEGARS